MPSKEYAHSCTQTRGSSLKSSWVRHISKLSSPNKTLQPLTITGLKQIEQRFALDNTDVVSSNGDGLQPNSHGLQPDSDGLQPTGFL